MKYLIVTPARNEEDLIESTIESVLAQTVKPCKWIIVSDGSTDRTDEIAQGYAEKFDWIELYRRPERDSRDFSGKANCFNAGYKKVSDVPHDVVVSLDADLTFDPEYFEFLLGKLAEDSSLGLVGTPFAEDGKTYDYRFTNIEHVSGACQVFRKECFDQVGGYIPVKGGGIDWIAVTSARMKGWKTRTFTEMVCHHHRIMGTGVSSSLGAWFRKGMKDYCLGGHFLWQVFRSTYQLSRKPFLLGGFLLMAGYLWAWLSRKERPVSGELMAFHRSEQLGRLKAVFGVARKSA